MFHQLISYILGRAAIPEGQINLNRWSRNLQEDGAALPPSCTKDDGEGDWMLVTCELAATCAEVMLLLS